MNKKKVSLDVFEESVLPMLQQKHAKIEDLQKCINDEYAIYEESEDGKQKTVKFTVSAKAEAEAEDAVDIKKLVSDTVAATIKEMTKTEGNPLGKQDKKEFKIPAECKQYGTLKAFTGKSNDQDADMRAFRFGMWGLAIRGSDTAKTWCAENGIGLNIEKYSTPLIQKLQSEGVNSAGGYLVPEEFGRDLIVLREQYGIARRLCNIVPMTSDTRVDPRQTGGLTPYFVAEGAAGTESTTSYDQIRLTVKDLMVLSRMTNQVAADAVINFGDKLAFECAYAFALKEDQCLLNGDATSTYGGITGVRTQLANKWTAAVAGTYNGITKASSTTIASMTLADFESAVGSLPQYAAARNPVWVVNTFFYYSTMLRLALAAGGNAQLEISNGDRRPRPMFLGFPVEFSQVMPTTTAATTIFALLGDFSLGVSFGDRQQNMVSFSEHATVGGESVFERNEVAVRATERFDINVHDVGDGTTTGPIVAVATG